ncbi:oligosaccharide flippase family protein [Pararoseomonas indoligenes]|uniref:Oligosaccharide flippase family protein n=1 Tax=Roseomonas indoligenes TaxID=2820811 RepID=A0A940S8H7_9PROT|nr:oligosaccharide flippase family protein [Pararoseomonas indoligenes]MBP0496109.1 oligosaccharide flippase family protein [Pararoseomonas indoligenes]
MSGNAGPSRGSILAATARGAGWVMAWRTTTRLLGLASTLILVRLLPPSEFGLVALATAFALALDACVSIGVEDQLVRSHDPRPELYDTAFTLNLLRCLFLSVLIAVAAWPAAGFFGDPKLAPVLLALSISAAAYGLTNVAIADFRRHLSFEKEFQLQFLPRVAGIVVTVMGAWLLASHWALVLGILVNRIGLVVASHLLHPYRPRLSLAAWRELAGVSGWSWANSLATVVRDRADSFVIGRVLGPARLGVYAVGAEVAVLPTTEMVDPICRACMPGFAAALRQGDPVLLEDAYLRIVGLTALLTIPAGFGISLVAGPVVALAFGPAWIEAVPVVQILGVASTLTLFGGVSAAMLSARTALRTLLGVTITAAALRVVLLVLLTRSHGLEGAGLAVGLAVAAEHLLLVSFALRTLRLTPWRFLAQLRRPAVATAAMAAALVWGGLGWAPAPATTGAALSLLLTGVALGVVVFVAVLALLWLAAGRPAGAEADMAALLRRITGRFAGLRGRAPLVRES